MVRKTILLLCLTVLAGCGAASGRMAAQESERRAAEYEMLTARQEAQEITCRGTEQCDRFFRVASDVVMEKSDMKVQTATNNYVSTFNPIKIGRIGMTARRVLGSNGNEIIKLDISCKDEYNIAATVCYNSMAAIYRDYKVRIESQK